MQNSKEKIIEAAIEVFFEKGFDAASMRVIAERAGLTKPMIYYHFKNKEALYLELLEEHLEVFCNQLEAIVGSEDEYKKIFYAVIDLYDATFSKGAKIYHIIQREISGNGRLVGFLTEKYFSRIFIHLASFLRKGIQKGFICATLDSSLAGLSLSSILLFYFSQGNVLEQLSQYVDPEVFSGSSFRTHILDLFIEKENA